MTPFFIWLMGWLFTVGYTMEKAETFSENLTALFLVFLWPLALGAFLREQRAKARTDSQEDQPE